MTRRPIIIGLSAVALSLILKLLYNSDKQKQAVAPVEQPQQSLSPNQESSASPSATEISASSKAAIWSAIQQGRGYVVLMRHAIAPGIGDPPDFRLNDCSTQRNLSDEGRKQAVRTGKAFKNRNIQVSRVLSSQWCRCLETAKLMNLGAVEPFPPLNSFFLNHTTESKQTAQVRQLILDNRNTAGVIVMITHEVNIRAIASDIYPESGESVVLRANKKNKIEVVGQIRAM
ncbi:histidine phosphatase family protein [Komarekiella sp. 'clone 1']|uniref:Histidine phosphatase family protein n=1 Tax=Komarekiella delphini-convector SJRDD-AB1 TaxID=2593771 RepID=A0AA40SXT1_9NOST|nr:histidine phosphatase family protein [Komarekiella delphini-convector]MBD6617004.1 histidine phosphatase family protein [Komarekiella delphini-convector SJRDD-AB1]